MTPIDLRELAIERRPTSATESGPRTPWLSRYVLPSGLMLGFAALLTWSSRESLMPRTPVTVVPVITGAATAVPQDTPLFRAAGWIEPRPTPVHVTALVEGIVEELLVVEGQAVQAGDVIALLVKRDAEIGLNQTQADLSLQQAQRLSAEANLAAAQTYFREPVERQAALSEAEAALAKIRTEAARLPAALAAAEARLQQSRKELDSKSRSVGAVASILVDRARSDVDVAEAQIQELMAQKEALRNEDSALSKRRDVLQRQLDLKIEEARKLKDAEAQHQAADARIQQAEAALAAAQLRLERMTVRAPITGKVLALVARPGSKLMGLDRAALADASTVVTMYDPGNLQVRADVRLEDVPQVQLGQKVRVETAALTEPLVGRVLAMTSLTDIQKNTLQVKVALENPSPVLKPDMLVEATFLSLPQSETIREREPTLRLMIPEELATASEEGSTVWLADRVNDMAVRRSVTLGQRLDDGLVEVTAGLAVGDRLIAGGRERMSPGARIRIVGEMPESHRNSSNATAEPQK